MPSGPGALSGDAARMASLTSFSVINGSSTWLPYFVCRVPSKSASGGIGKNVFRYTSALPAGSVIRCCVSGCLMAGVTTGGGFPLVLAQLTSLHNASGDCAACSTRSLWASLNAFWIVLALRFLAARYASHDSSVCRWLCVLLSRFASASTTLHSSVHPSLLRSDGRVRGTALSKAFWMVSIISWAHVSSAVLLAGLRSGGRAC
jgi:hypothetical protein